MKSETPIDYAVFQLSPKRSRCELFISRDGNVEKLASGLLKPFVAQLKIAEEQVALSAKSIKLEAENYRDGERWFTKGTLERFVRFVSTPEVLEMVNTFDAEMSQLEAARVIYSQGVEDHTSSTSGRDRSGATTAADATKKELLRAIDVRLAAVKQDIATTCARAAAAGFNHDSVSELQIFSDQFGAYRLNDACNKFLSLCERRPDLMNSWNSGVDDRTVRSSYGSDMSIDYEATKEQIPDEQSGEQSKLSSWQQLNSSSPTFSVRRSRECSTERDDTSSALEKKEESSGEVEPLKTQPGPPARRLSVQDRISLFENKQKETSTGSGGKPVVAKSSELRRLSSDISSGSTAAEKAVLRRWSGVSDMSISVDLSDEKKEVDNPGCTSSLASAPQPKPDDRKNLHSAASFDKPEFRSIPGIVCEVGTEDQTAVSVREEGNSKKDFVNPIIPMVASSGRTGDSCESENSDLILKTSKVQDKNLSNTSSSQAGVKDQPTSESQSRSFSFDRADRFGFKKHGRSRSSYGNDEQQGTIEQSGTLDQATSEMQIANLKKGGLSEMKPVTFASKSSISLTAKESYQPSGDHIVDREEDLGSMEQSAPRSRLRAPVKTAMDSRQSDGGSKIREAFSAQYRGSLGDPLASQVSMESIKETEEMKKQALASSEKHYASPILKIEDSGIPKNVFQKQDPAREHTRKSQKSTSSSVHGNNKTSFSGKMAFKDQEDIFTTPETEQLQRIRQTKGNQELNDELKIKANELEKLFAEHKLRAPVEQSNSTRRSKPNDMQTEQVSSSLPERKQVEDTTPQLLDKNMIVSSGSLSNMEKLNEGLHVDFADNQNYMDNVKYNVSDFGLLDESRGKCYDTYMQKRDTKLREEWGSRRTEKEAKLKEMQDIFECSRREMWDKLLGSTDRNDSAYSARRRAERLRSFKNQSSLKIEQPDFLQSDDEDPLELAEQKSFGQESSINDASLGNGASRSSQNKRVLPNRNFSSSTPRNLAVASSRSASKASNSSLARRRMQSENPLVQSVPNFSDLRKENTKPYSAGSKIARPQLRNYTRSRSTNEEIPNVKEEKSRRSQSVKKTSMNPAETKGMSAFNSDAAVLSPRKFDSGQTEQSRYDKPFLQNKYSGGRGVGEMKLKASMFKSIDNDDESDELSFDPEDSAALVRDEDDEASLTRTAEENLSMDHREASVGQESAKLNTSGSEDGDVLHSSSQVDKSLFPSSTHSTLHAVGAVQESPGESPMSWNSRVQHPFSYPHDGSDIDASVDSPMGSPASWNLHPLNQTEADAARMRKKWGSAQKPMIGANLSSTQSRKDVSKGFKRLLKFGRKSRGTESLVDWISATTSEGDDDTEDGRDLANRSSEDLRKSRMGFSQDHASEESFRESDFYSEQALRSSIPAPPANFRLREDHLSGSSMKAPRSFFSLSSFRSKGESKLR
ncbi:uncharacterized protein LOC108227169 [Daucus carota subsp. sativus]|uniref:uncharacterized protein LOC108227169 n=1 Tax=Daucus carota subsp. sativus TaxID=79200 RepID=UPI0007F03B4D|nr:PREDICTED: uncharacterized protein LOC108227169 [Daucus carota subsp. sativus]XP_017257670.1 PREDICTED: uncharacterized protein LOC108227169 [Daucus carota subsp. sativus]XP_017257671.1 PREDICTED: uncharacterized protein LOC108227169 [Daucus carota subsp. sativus]